MVLPPNLLVISTIMGFALVLITILLTFGIRDWKSRPTLRESVSSTPDEPVAWDDILEPPGRIGRDATDPYSGQYKKRGLKNRITRKLYPYYQQ